MKTKTYILFFFLLAFFITACTGEPESQDRLTISGTVRQKRFGPVGTFSEYHYFILEEDSETETPFTAAADKSPVLFNQELRSMGFEDYQDKEVIIEYEKVTGYVGFRKTEKEGLLVLSIIEKEPAPSP